MRKKLIYCEHCGGTELAGTDAFLVFHQLTFCCVDCRDDYRAANEAQREGARAAATLATVAEVMRRDNAAAVRKSTPRSASRRDRAA
jgi:hypothetical protein